MAATLDGSKLTFTDTGTELAENINLIRHGRLRILNVFWADTTDVKVPLADRPSTDIPSCCMTSTQGESNMIVSTNGNIYAAKAGVPWTTCVMRGQCVWTV